MFLPEAALFREACMEGRGIGDPCLTYQAFAMPDSTIQVELPQLQLVSWRKVGAAAHVRLAGGHQVQVVPAELKRAGKMLFEEVGQPGVPIRGDRATHQVQIAGAIHCLLIAWLRDHREIESVLVPVRLRPIALHAVFIAGRCIVVVVTGIAGGHGHDVLESHVLLALVRIRKGAVPRKQWIDGSLRTEC